MYPPQYNKSEAYQTYKNVTQKYRFQFKIIHMKNLINTLTSPFNLERLHPKSIKSHPKFFNFLILDIGWQYLAVIGVGILNLYSILWC